MDVPVIPLPTMTISASAGISGVVRWPSKNSLGSLCQKDFVDSGVGRLARSCSILLVAVRQKYGVEVDGSMAVSARATSPHS